MFDDVCSLLWSSCSANCPFNQICIWVFGCRFVSDNGHRISQVFLWSWIFVELFWSVFVHHQHCYLAENNSCKNAGGWRGLRGFGASKAFNQKRCIIIAWSWKPMVSKRPLIWKRPIGIGGKNPRGIGGFPVGPWFPWGWHHPDLHCWEWCLFTYPAIACFPLGSVDPNVPRILAANGKFALLNYLILFSTFMGGHACLFGRILKRASLPRMLTVIALINWIWCIYLMAEKIQ